MSLIRCSATALLPLFATVFFTPACAAELKVNDTAPDFNLPATDGNMYRLSDLTDDGIVVLAWFPKAFTEG